MLEYPKMLYLANGEYAVAKTAGDEDELRKAGYRAHDEEHAPRRGRPPKADKQED